MYYTKYRPQTFSEIAKPNDVASALSNQIKSGKTVHAYLFVGPRGTGKTTTARVLAKALNCKNLDKNGDPCTECDACIAIKNGTYLDLIEIDAASNRGIDDIRELREKIKLAPSAGKNKVYIIDEVHMLTPEAFNALLKTLEEPPKNVTFILCTTELHKVPETIKSRCQVFKFKRATIKQLTEKLKLIADGENVSISEQELRQIANAAHGGFRDAENVLQQVVEGEIDVSSLVSLGSKESFADFMDMIINKETKEALRFVKKLFEDGIDLYVWIGELLSYFRELLFLQVDAYENLEDVSNEVRERMEKQAKLLSTKNTSTIIDTIIKAQNDTKDSFITQLPIEVAIVRLCQSGRQNEATENEVNFPKAPVDPKTVGPKPTESNPAGTDPTEPKDDEGKKTETKDKKSKPKNETEKKTEAKESEANNSPEQNIVNIDLVSNSWTTIIQEVSTINNSVSALLKTAKVSCMQGKRLVLEVPFDFHKERLESSKNRTIVEEKLSSILDNKISIKCEVKKREIKKKPRETGNLTDYNVTVPKSYTAEELSENIIDVFDGGLPFD